MIQTRSGHTASFKTGGAVTKGAIVMFGADDDTVVVATAATDFPIGVAIADQATTGARVEVALSGVVDVKLGGSVTRGNDITSGAAGVGVALTAAATIKSAIGRAMASGSSGDLCPVLISPWSAVTA